MKRGSIKLVSTIANWRLCFLVILVYSCSPKPIRILKNEPILTWMKNENVPTVGVCIIENAKIQQVQVFGNIEYHSPAPVNTLFNLASLTKPLISMTTLKLVSNGQWQLDEPLCHYWTDPDVASDTFNKKLTTRHVLSHQSGLPNWRGNEPVCPDSYRKKSRAKHGNYPVATGKKRNSRLY